MPGTLLRSIFPGDEPAVSALRAQLLQAASTPGLTTLVLQGPPGTGKTTIARAIAAARMLTMVDHSRLPFSRERLIGDVRRGRPLKWYRDLSLAGLSPTLADVQLFGVVKSYATDVKPRIGIFERAMTGSLKEFDEEPHRKIVERETKVDIIPRLTGGVVLLDEIGDLNAELQAKLLRVLNGEVQYRMGGEGNNDFGLSFRGLVVLATWRELGDQVLRPDLRQRLLQNHVQVPSLSEYSTETRRLFLASVAEDLRQVALEELAHLNDCEPENESLAGPSPDWRSSLEKSTRFKLAPEVVDHLASANWQRLGEFRGMRAVLRRMMNGMSAQDAILATEAVADGDLQNTQVCEPAREDDSATLLNDITMLIRAAKAGASLSANWGAWKRAWAARLYEQLRSDGTVAMKMLSSAGIDADTIKQYRAQLKNLKRDAASGPGDPERS